MDYIIKIWLNYDSSKLHLFWDLTITCMKMDQLECEHVG